LNNNAITLKKCRDLDREIRHLIIKDRKSRLESHLSNYSKGQSLWNGVKTILNKPINKLPDLIDSNEVAFEGSELQAECFAEFFEMKTSKITEKCKVVSDVYNGESILQIFNENFMTFRNMDLVYRRLKRKKSYGSDNIPMIVIIDLYPLIRVHLHDLFNKIYETKQIPKQWKISRTLPLHKKGRTDLVENYRPISNICSIAKIFENLILLRIKELDVDFNLNLTGNNQHGFKKYHSTITAGLELQSKISDKIDNGEYVGVASFDLSAAFDMVDRRLLLKRMTKLGFPADVLDLVREWLNNRYFYVEISGKRSDLIRNEYGTI